jgi:hypothetical protein
MAASRWPGGPPPGVDNVIVIGQPFLGGESEFEGGNVERYSYEYLYMGFATYGMLPLTIPFTCTRDRYSIRHPIL